MDAIDIAIKFVIAAVVFATLLQVVPVLTWVERRGSAFLQNRLGPNRVNIFGISLFGLIQPLADGVKFLMKETVIPDKASKVMFTLAPSLAVVTAFMAFAVLPFGPEIEVMGRTIRLQVANLNIGVLYVLAFGGLAVYGIIVAGWASNNKYALFGSLRSSAQMISYELAMGLSVLAAILMAASVDPMVMVEKQGSLWFGLTPWGFLPMLIFLVCSYAETNRLPFDLPEGESELVAGYHVEYSGLRFSMFFMAEYVHMITASAMITTLFLGGWNGFVPGIGIGGIDLKWLGLDHLVNLLGGQFDIRQFPYFLLPLGAFVGKTAFFLWLYVWVRWTLPRFRYDQLMFLGWKILLPVAIINVFIIAGVLALGLPATLFAGG